MVLCVYKNNVLLTRCLPTCRPRPPPHRPGGGGGLTGGTQSAPLLDGIRRDKSVPRRCLWAIPSPSDNPSHTGVKVRTPEYSEDSGVRTRDFSPTAEKLGVKRVPQSVGEEKVYRTSVGK